jgi:hypothetical protein
VLMFQEPPREVGVDLSMPSSMATEMMKILLLFGPLCAVSPNGACPWDSGGNRIISVAWSTVVMI